MDILRKLGCLDAAGMAKLRTGNAPTVTKGPYVGGIASVDHIIPRSVCEELDERLYNLEFMPSKMNSASARPACSSDSTRDCSVQAATYCSGLV